MLSLDVHILTLDSTNPEQLQQALDSIEAAKAKCSMDVHVHVVEGVPNHMGLSRKKGYALGSASYVTSVDHDDWIDENAFKEIEKALVSSPNGVTTGEWMVAGEYREARPTYQHHLAVFKREWLEQQQYSEYKFYADHFLVAASKAIHIPKCLYYCRLAPNSASRKQRAAFPKEAADEAKRIHNKKLMLIEHMTNKQIAELIEQELQDG